MIHTETTTDWTEGTYNPNATPIAWEAAVMIERRVRERRELVQINTDRIDRERRFADRRQATIDHTDRIVALDRRTAS